MRWASPALAAAAVLLPIGVMGLIKSPPRKEILDVWLGFSLLNVVVAAAANLLFLFAMRRKTKAAQAMWLLAALGAAAYFVSMVVGPGDAFVGAPAAVHALLCLGYAGTLGHCILKRDGRRLQFRLRSVLILTAVVAAAIGSWQCLDARYGSMPHARANYRIGDLDGVATFAIDPFVVQFEGRSFDARWRMGSLVVDGRRSAMSRWLGLDLRLYTVDHSNWNMGYAACYSEEDRTLTIEYAGHTLVYSHSRKRLAVDGQEFDVGPSGLWVVVRQDGTVENKGDWADPGDE